MFLTCHKCNTQYQLPLGAIGENGKKVRCKNCSHTWFQKFISEETPDNAQEIESTIAENTKNRKEYKSNIGNIFKILFVIILIITAVNISIYSESFPSIFGQGKTDSVIFDNLTINKHRGDTGWNIDIKLSIKNMTDKYQKIPPIYLKIMSKGGRIMNQFILKMEVNEIPPNEIITTERVLENIAGSTEKIIFDIGNNWELSFREN